MSERTHIPVHTAYGIDARADRVVIVCGVRHRSQVNCEVLYDGPADSSGSFTEVQNRVVAEQSRGKAVTAGFMAVSASTMRWLKTPFASLSKSRQVLPSLLDIQLPFALEKCSYVFPYVEPEAGHVHALAIAAPRESVTRVLEEHRSLFAEPVLLDHEGLACWTQSLRERPNESGAMRVVGSLYSDHAVLALGRGKRLISSHNCTLRGNQGPASLSAKVQRILHADTQNNPGAEVEWVWTGPCADDDSLISMYEAALKSDRVTAFSRHDKNASFLARALATRALLGKQSCDLRTGELVHTQRTQWRRQRSVRLASAYAVLGLTVCLLNLGWTHVLARHEASLQDALGAIARDVYGPGVQYGQEVRMAREALDAKRTSWEPFLRAFQQSPSRALAAGIEKASAAGLELETLSVRPDAISIKGTAGDWDRCAALEELALGLGYEPKLDRQDAGADERVHFSFRGGRSYE